MVAQGETFCISQNTRMLAGASAAVLVLLGASLLSSPTNPSIAAYSPAVSGGLATVAPTSTLYGATRGRVLSRVPSAQRAAPVLEEDIARQRNEDESQPAATASWVANAMTIPAALASLAIVLVAKALRTVTPATKAELTGISTYQPMASDAANVPRNLGANVALGVATAAAIGNATIAQPATALSLPGVPPSNDQVYTDAWTAVANSFIDKSFNGLDWNKIKEDALAKNFQTRDETYDEIRAELKLLGDPFTRLMEPEQYNNIKRRLTGRLTGVGLEIGPVKGESKMVVVDRIRGSPADKAGIEDGEFLLAVDGKPVGQSTQFEIAESLVGNKDTKVTLTMQSRGQDPRDIPLQREQIIFQQVLSGVCEDVSNQEFNGTKIEKLGYIRVPSFNYSTAAEFNKALKEDVQGGAQGIVIDLRNNTGGSLNAAYEMANSVLQQGEIVRVIGADGKVTSAQVRGRAQYPDIPLTLLVNGRTASSSEVLGAALKTAGRAVLAGEQTFGKGQIQDIKTLPDGSALFVTKERYLTPTNQEIDKVGITPTIGVDGGLLDIKKGIPAQPAGFCAAMSKDAPGLFSGPSPPPPTAREELDLAGLSAFA